jgi:hypothetical protein
MTNHSGDGLIPGEVSRITVLESIYFPVDSQVSLAYQESDTGKILLQEIYKTGPELPLTFTPFLQWSSGEFLPPKVKRDDYQGISINAAAVASSNKFLYPVNI